MGVCQDLWRMNLAQYVCTCAMASWTLSSLLCTMNSWSKTEILNVYKSFCLCFQPSHLFLTELLKGDTNIVASYYQVVSTLLTMLLCLASYEQCNTQLLKVLHKCCNKDVFGVLLIYPYSQSGVHWDGAYILVKPLAVVLQYIMYVCTYVTTYMKSQHRQS